MVEVNPQNMGHLISIRRSKLHECNKCELFNESFDLDQTVQIAWLRKCNLKLLEKFLGVEHLY